MTATGDAKPIQRGQLPWWCRSRLAASRAPTRRSNSRTFVTERTYRAKLATSASLIGHSGSSAFQTIHHYSVDVAHGLALLFGIGTRGPSIMGFEDEVEQSFGRPCRQTNGRSKRTCELTSSIVPRGTSFHRSVELECPSIGLDAARFFMLLLLWPVLGSSGTRCRQPICGA